MWPRILRACAGACLFASLVPFFARAQESPLDEAASSIAAAINQSREKHQSVLVCDFISGRGQLTALGVHVGDQASASLARAAGSSFRVIDCSQSIDTLHNMGLERETANGPCLEEIVARRLKADFFISGRLSFQKECRRSI
jgi:hypothetical protein